jgi:serine/threonine protein kinase
MIAMLGPPPLVFLRKAPQSRKYWDSNGRWKGAIEVPQCSLEDSEEYLEGENKKMFMQFVRKMLRWDPEERQSARELLTDPWLIAQ